MQTEWPRVMVVSNNVMCRNDNNGQTIISLLENYPTTKISQLYFSQDMPDDNGYENFFRISDRDVLNKFLHKAESCGRVVTGSNPRKKARSISSTFLKKNTLVRLIREVIWQNRWRSDTLIEWIQAQAPSFILFVASDCLFPFAICNEIMTLTDARCIMFLTDDYLTKSFVLSPFWWIKRSMVEKRFMQSLSSTDCLITISNEMAREYKALYNVDSLVFSNIPKQMIDISYDENEVLKLTYAGTLSHKRYITLYEIGRSIARYNQIAGKTVASMTIYTSEKNRRILRRFKKFGISCYIHEHVDKETLCQKYQKSDILVFAESFYYRNRRAIRLSVSTKVLDYLSYSKPILAVGPKCVSSMQLLKGAALCAERKCEIEECVNMILRSKETRDKLRKKSKALFIREQTNMQSSFLTEIVKSIYNKE